MKTGVIVYVVGADSRDDEFNEQLATSGLGVEADRVEFVFPDEGEDSLSQAWLNMTVKGMARIVCMSGELVRPSVIRLTHHQMQLSGIC